MPDSKFSTSDKTSFCDLIPFSNCGKLRKNTIKAYPSGFVIGSIQLLGHADHKVHLQIIPTTKLSYPFLRDALVSIRWQKYAPELTPDNWVSQYHSIVFRFDLAEDSISTTQTIFEKIFNALSQFNITKNDYDYFYAALEEYFSDYLKNNDDSKYRVVRADSFPRESNSNLTYEEMFTAAVSPNSKKMWEILRKGVDPNAYNGSSSILTAATEWTSHFIDDQEEVLKIIKLLIVYGANPNYGYKTSLEAIVGFNSIDHPLCLKIIPLLQSSKYAFPHIRVHSSCTAIPIGRLIDETNNALVLRDSAKLAINNIAAKLNAHVLQPQPSIYDIQAHFSNKTLWISFPTNLGKEIKVESRRTAVIGNETSIITDEEREQLFEVLKRNRPGWEELITEKGLRAYLDKNLKENIGDEFHIDIVWVNDKIRAFSAAGVVKTAGSPNEIIYHVRLAAADKEICDFKKFNTFFSFSRGFAWQKCYPDSRVFLVYEASLDGYGQAVDMRFIPMYESESTENTVLKEKEVLYPYSDEKITKEDGIYYVSDTFLSKPKKTVSPQNPNSFWSASRKNFDDVFEAFIRKDGKVPIVIIPANKENFQRLNESINSSPAFVNLPKPAFQWLVNIRAAYEKLVSNNLHCSTIRGPKL